MSFVGTNILHHVSKKEDKVIEKEHAIVSSKSFLDVLNLSTNDANKVIEPFIDFSSSDDECFIDLCDKQSAMIIPMPQLVKETDSFVLDQNACAENKQLFSIATEKDELKLLSSLNTLSYIEFDNLCALSSLEEKFKCAKLCWLFRCTYYFIGKYNCKGDYMVHRVYICSNLNSPFGVHQYDQIEGCNIDNNIMWRFPSFALKK